jgi:hypothetical protein
MATVCSGASAKLPRHPEQRCFQHHPGWTKPLCGSSSDPEEGWDCDDLDDAVPPNSGC